jgi:glycerol-3-phosphate cytidylyltransferase
MKYKTGFTASTFDLLHPGHLIMLKEAKSQCEHLIVGLLTDPTISRPDGKNKPVESTYERYVRLDACEYVDEIIPFDTEEDLENMLYVLMPEVRFVGEEYKDKNHTGKNIEGIQIIYNKRRHSFSSTNTREKINGN